MASCHISRGRSGDAGSSPARLSDPRAISDVKDGMKPTRKILAIATAGVENVNSTQCNHITTALCDDGTVWELRDNKQYPAWAQLPPIPQPNTEGEEQ